MQGERYRRDEWAQTWVTVSVIFMLLVTIPALLFIAARFTLFDPQVYKDSLDQSGLYQNYPQIMGGTLAGEANMVFPGVGSQLLGKLDQAHYYAVIRLIFPETWVRSQTEGLVDQFWSFFNRKIVPTSSDH